MMPLTTPAHIYRPRPHTRIAGFFAIILGLFVMLNSACATPLDESLTASEKKIRSRFVDMGQLFQGLHGEDQEAAFDIGDVAKLYLCKIEHIRDLRWIESEVCQNEADKRKVELIIRSRLGALVEEIDQSIKLINAATGVLHSNAALLIASKLKDDLRELKELPGR